MSQPPLNVSIEKIYTINEAGNVKVERSWILFNRGNTDIDISDLNFYVEELADAVVDIRAEDSSGAMASTESRSGNEIRISLTPRPTTLSQQQTYKMTLVYDFPNMVHKLGDAWLFTELIEGMNPSDLSALTRGEMELTLQTVLPKLEKRFWQTLFHESAPKGSELSKQEKTHKTEKHTVLEWKTSLSPHDHYQLELIYGLKTNTRLAQFLTGVGTAIAAGIVKLIFDLMSG